MTTSTHDAQPTIVATGQMRLMRKRRPEHIAVDATSVALFRLGEQCNNRCPMCSNSGRPEAFFIPTPELLIRAERLDNWGFRRVVVTGGEPTIHPGFWDVVTHLRHLGVRWDINTHGRSFSESGFADRALALGLRHAIVSLHSHLEPASCAISGVKPKAHHEAIAGIDALIARGVHVTINAVVTTLNRDHLEAFIDWIEARWGAAPRVKMAFPSTTGKGGDWPGLALQYGAIQPSVRRLIARSEAGGPTLLFESFPNCILGRADSKNIGRSGFGETHYLDDIKGESLFSIRHIEAELSAYPESCKGCQAIARCPGVSEGYLRAYGADEFVPFLEPESTEVIR